MTEEARPGPEQPAPEAGGGRGVLRDWRRWAPWVILVVATIVAIVSSLTVWVQRQALNTDAWADASRELIQDEEVRSATASYLVDEIFARRDVAGEVQAALPAQVRPLAPAITAALNDVALRITNELLERPRVQEAWVRVNVAAHRTLLAVVDEEPIREGGRVVVEGDEVVLDLSPLVQDVAARIGVEDRLQPDAGRIVVATSSQFSDIRTAVNGIRFFSQVLGFVVLALYALAVWLAVGRRRTMLMAVGASIVVVGLVLLVARRWAGDYVIDTLVSDEATRPAGFSVWLISTSLLRDVAMGAILYGALLVVGAWLAGLSRYAVAVRRSAAPWLRSHPVGVGVGVGVLVLLVLTLLPGSSDRRLIGTLVLCALIVAGIAVLWRQTLREFPPSPPPSPAT